MDDQLNCFDKDLLGALSLACELDALKGRTRTGWNLWMVKGHRETIAEHCFSALILANVLHPLHPNRENIDLNRVNMMLIWHEIGEKIIGDIPLIDERHDSKEDAEHAAWWKLLEKLSEQQRDFVYNLLLEFDAHETPESKFAYYIDKLDANKTLKHYADAGRLPKLKAVLKEQKKVRKNKDVRELVESGAKTPVDVWFAERYAPYLDDALFMDAHKALLAMDTSAND